MYYYYLAPERPNSPGRKAYTAKQLKSSVFPKALKDPSMWNRMTVRQAHEIIFEDDTSTKEKLFLWKAARAVLRGHRVLLLDPPGYLDKPGRREE
jgi:hypothetical protein